MVLDVRAHTLGLDEVRNYVHPPDLRRPETLEHQRRVLRRWERDRERLHARYDWDPERLDQWQLDRVRMLVETAFATHPFYHRLYRSVGFQSGDLVDWSDYDALPAISKTDIIDNFDLFTDGRPGSPDDVYWSRTSGSSGKVLTILQDEGVSDAGHVFYMRHWERMLGRPRRADEWVYEIYLIPNRYSSLEGRFPVFTLTQEAPIELAVEHLRRVRPAVLSAFPSYLLRLAETYGDLRDLGVQAACVNSESSTFRERRMIGEALGAFVHDEYSSEELYLIAIECREQRYHIVGDNVRVDVLDANDAGQGEIVGTSLTNTYMPFIRYRQGDVIRKDAIGSGCPCGNRFATLAEFQGRADQFLRRSDGSVVAPDRVMGTYDATLLTGDTGVAEFQITQDEHGSIEVLIRRTADPVAGHDAAVEAFCRELRALIADERIGVAWSHVDAFPPGASYKRRLISSRFDPAGAAARQATAEG